MCLYCNAIRKGVFDFCLVLLRVCFILPAIKLPCIVFASRFLAFWICNRYCYFLFWVYPECLVKLCRIRCLVCSLYKYLNIILRYNRFLVRVFLLDYIFYASWRYNGILCEFMTIIKFKDPILSTIFILFIYVRCPINKVYRLFLVICKSDFRYFNHCLRIYIINLFAIFAHFYCYFYIIWQLIFFCFI